MALDSDVPNPLVGSGTEPLVHWMVLNIPNGDATNGQEVLSYMGPLPPDNKQHTYYFLLYKHSNPIPLDMDKYFGKNCSESLKGR